MNKKISLILLMLFIASSAKAAFENEYWGARAKGMAGTYVAIANDYSSQKWNPAGLDNLAYAGICLMYSRPFWGFDEEISLNNYYFSVSYPYRSYGTFAFCFTRFSATDLYNEDTYTLSYGVKLNNFWSTLPVNVHSGCNLNLFHQGFVLDKRTESDAVFQNGTTSRAFGMDIGFLFSPQHKDNSNFWTAGCSVFNINEPDIGHLNEDRIPRKYLLGAAYHIHISGFLKSLVLIPAVQWLKTENVPPKISLGSEIWIYNLLGWRIGWNANEVTTGLSIDYSFNKNFSLIFDYAFILPANITSSSSHMFSLSARFPVLTMK